MNPFLTGLFQGVSEGIPTAIQGYAKSQELTRQLDEKKLAGLERQAKFAMAQGDYHTAEALLAGHPEFADLKPGWGKQAQAHYDQEQAAKQAQTALENKYKQAQIANLDQDNTRMTLSTLIAGKQYPAANAYAQSNTNARTLLGMAQGQQGPLNVGFAAPPTDPLKVKEVNIKQQNADSNTVRAHRTPVGRGGGSSTTQLITVDANGNPVKSTTVQKGAKVVRQQQPKPQRLASDSDLRQQAEFDVGPAPGGFASDIEKAAWQNKKQALFNKLKADRDAQAASGGNKPKSYGKYLKK